jgi:hypothetical protein
MTQDGDVWADWTGTAPVCSSVSVRCISDVTMVVSLCTTDDQPDVTTVEQKLEVANKVRTIGNEYFKNKDYANAVRKYEKVVPPFIWAFVLALLFCSLLT